MLTDDQVITMKPRFLGLKPSPMNAGQVWHLDLCATLGICDQLFKVKMAKLQDFLAKLEVFHKIKTKVHSFLESSLQGFGICD